jgi:fucose 4-O-acetylase-like acetyltransferase
MVGSTDWPRVRPDRLSLPQGLAPKPPLKERVDSLESATVQTLRGLACLLLVAFHAVGASAASGLHVPDDSWYRQFTNLFVHIRMPLFTILSGLVYAYRPLRPGQALRFSGKKVRRLGVPFVVASTVLYGLHFAMHHQVPPPARMWNIYVFPYWHMWFVQALLPVFAALVVLESLGALSTFRRFLMVFTLSLVLYLDGPFEGQNALGLHNATYLLPFFLWGLGAHRYRHHLRTSRALTASVVCFVVSQCFHSYIVLTRALPPIDSVAIRSAWSLLIGMSAGLCALELLPRVRLLEQIGGSSYPIYLYHPIFVAAVISGAGALLTLPMSLLFVVAGTAGVVGPMLMRVTARRIPLGQLLLEGQWPDGSGFTNPTNTAGASEARAA